MTKDQPSRLTGMTTYLAWRHLKPRHFNRDPTAPWLCRNQRMVVDLWQVQSLQGNNRAATQGSNQSKLMSQIPMVLQLARAVGGIKKPC